MIIITIKRLISQNYKEKHSQKIHLVVIPSDFYMLDFYNVD